MSTADPAVWALAGVVGGWAVTQGAIEWFRYRARRRAWEEYEKQRAGWLDSDEQGNAR